MKTRRTRDVFLLAALFAVDAGAHGLHQAGGTVTVDEKRATVVLRLAGEHGTAAPWVDGLVLRDSAGERLALVVLSRGEKVVELAADLPGRPRHLAFQLLPLPADSGADSVRRRLVLTVRSAGLDGERQLTLTNGGNVEIVTFAWPAPPAETVAPDACGLDTAGRTLRGVLRRDGEDLGDLRLDVLLPIGLLETWQPLPRRDTDWLQPSEQEGVRPRILDLAANAWALHVGGEARPPAATSVAFLGLDDGPFDEPSARVSAWTGSVRLTARWRSPASAGELEWKLWNGAVLTADVAVAAGEASVRCRWRTLSTYAPRLPWAGPQ